MPAQAQLWLGGQDFELIEVELPELQPDELIVDMQAAAICGSDRHTVEGRRSSPQPSILGHEGVGVVSASRRKNVPVGTRVVFGVTVSCGECEYCSRGLTAKCTTVRKMGHESFKSSWPLSGTYATQMQVLAGQEVVAVPESVPNNVAATASCAVATVMAVVEAAGPLEGRTVLVNGIGMLGAVAIVEAKRQGAARVIGCDPGVEARRNAPQAADELVANVNGLSADVVLELSGARQGVADSVATLNIGGVAVLAGSVVPTPPIDLDPEWIVRGYRTITGVHNYEPRHLTQAVDFLASASSALQWESILDGPIALRDLPQAFAQGSRKPRTVVEF